MSLALLRLRRRTRRTYRAALRRGREGRSDGSEVEFHDEALPRRAVLGHTTPPGPVVVCSAASHEVGDREASQLGPRRVFAGTRSDVLNGLGARAFGLLLLGDGVLLVTGTPLLCL